MNIAFRAEDFKDKEVLEYYVELPGDREILENLKSKSPVLLRGSRGVGKSFLLRIVDVELSEQYSKDKILPVYMTLAPASFVKVGDEGFTPWMISKISQAIKRSAEKMGITITENSSIYSLINQQPSEKEYIKSVEEFWRIDSPTLAPNGIPDIEDFKYSIEKFCEEYGIDRVILLIDEAAHVFLPQQQRDFFTMMRDMRSAYVSIKAAVYPGTTIYGPFFEPEHDAITVNIDRSLTHKDFTELMYKIVEKQLDLSNSNNNFKDIKNRKGDFNILAYASMGNPRILLKTCDYALAKKFRRSNTRDIFREYYRSTVWSEYSELAKRYPGHETLINWGRNFMEDIVLPGLHSSNMKKISDGGKFEAISSIWVHKNSPKVVQEALRLLSYSGFVSEGTPGIRGADRQVGTRYLVNLGCSFAEDKDPLDYGEKIMNNFSTRRVAQYGINHESYKELKDVPDEILGDVGNIVLVNRLKDSYENLDLTNFQKKKLKELGVSSIEDILRKTEDDLKSLKQIGDVRARQIMNAALTAVMEYVSG